MHKKINKRHVVLGLVAGSRRRGRRIHRLPEATVSPGAAGEADACQKVTRAWRSWIRPWRGAPQGGVVESEHSSLDLLGGGRGGRGGRGGEQRRAGRAGARRREGAKVPGPDGEERTPEVTRSTVGEDAEA